MRRLLIIEDNLGIRDAMVRALSRDFQVIGCGTIRDAERELAGELPDLILLDAELPDGDGFRFCATLRTLPGLSEVPIIFITAHTEVSERVMGLTLGADDYLPKPFELSELRARIDVQLRRTAKSKAARQELTLHDLHLDASHQRATIRPPGGGAETTVSLTSLEFRLLFHLASHPGQVFSREELVRSVWGESIHVTGRAVDTHVSQVRKKIAASKLTIVAVHNVGYRLVQRDSAASTRRCSA